ncbi:MAG: SCO family protein [Verrucomicrobiota bacterium]
MKYEWNQSDMKTLLSLVLSLALAALLTGCGKPEPKQPPPTSGHTNAAPQIFETRGVVRSIPEGGHSLVVRHEEIPGYMPKMTMELTVRDTNEITGITKNDEITFQLVATTDTHWIQNIKRIGKVAEQETIAPATPGYALVKELEIGDSVPDYELLAEDGRTVRFSDFRGQAVAFTFIFSRCPLPDFCPRMGNNFAATREVLRTNTAAGTNWQFLSISFDPEYDSPEVLHVYARSYRHDNPDRWLFVTASQKVLSTFAPELDLMLAKEEGGSISHNLRTVVLDPLGRIHKLFNGNRWTPEELATAIQEAAKIQ